MLAEGTIVIITAINDPEFYCKIGKIVQVYTKASRHDYKYGVMFEQDKHTLAGSYAFRRHEVEEIPFNILNSPLYQLVVR